MSAVEAAPARSVARSGYLHQIDIVRLLTFAAVIGVHSVANASQGDNVAANGVEVFLHFTRDAFFTLTGFVLFYTNYDKPLDLKRFWSRRFPVVLVPYIVWTSIYFWFWLNNQHDLTFVPGIQRYGYDLLTGAAEYHLYFLLVSMQIYALFPVLRWAVQKTTGYHWQLIGGLFVANAALTGWIHYADHAGAWRVFALNNQELVTTYAVFVFAGALAAVHKERFDAWLRSHHPLVIIGFVASLVFAEVVYRRDIKHGELPAISADPLQPAIMVWSVFMILALYLMGLWWSDKREPASRAAAVISEASRASFGVYLVHPLFILLAANIGVSWQSSFAPPAVDAVLGWTIAVALSGVFVELMLRTRLAMPLTGRHRQD